MLNKNMKNEAKIEAFVARDVYGLTIEELTTLMGTFEKLSDCEKEDIIKEYKSENSIENIGPTEHKHRAKIPNHLSSKLSDLDMRIVHSVPPGGNWKNIPVDIPSKRIAQIRQSYALGKGSRSTYYGRLLASKPSYTINTYLNRPGNGCHIHYSQNRVLSQREAARLQSFPDSFVFSGPQGIVNTQIGNAVPPLLAYQIAKEIEKSLGKPGVFVDLFSGAGGMGLGFKWAGWTPLLANDINSRFLETYSNNVDSNVICGSIAEDSIFKELCRQATSLKKIHKGKPFWVLGGPPCQGFSTAGKKRTMEDPRNSLFIHYREFLEAVVPDGFVFENVAGLISMDKGAVFERVKREFSDIVPNLTGWVLNTDDYAIPQRRKRVILIGAHKKKINVLKPELLTSNGESDLFSNFKPWVSVEDALSDLPELTQGEDGSNKDYRSFPKSNYQKLMRGEISPQEYLTYFYKDIT
jgi:DNA (cytosine-5)-methyltransferase 1